MASGGGLAGGGAVGHERSDGPDGLGQVRAPAGPALQGPPVLAVGDGVLYADPCRGLGVAGLLPRLDHFRGRVFGGFLRRDADLARVVAAQAAVASVHLASDRPLWDMEPADADAYFGTVPQDAARAPGWAARRRRGPISCSSLLTGPHLDHRPAIRPGLLRG